MNYRETVNKVMELLKEKEVCTSSRKSHEDCYESLGLFMQRSKGDYSSDMREDWFSYIKKELPRQRYAVWVQYVYQLEEMDSTGTVSDRRLYLNHSNYDKLSESWKSRLDDYLDKCGGRYTERTLDLARKYCSEGLLLLQDLGAFDLDDLTYELIADLIGEEMHCHPDTRTLILNHTARMIGFYGEKGVCRKNYPLVFNCQVYCHVGSVSRFSEENRKRLDEASDPVMTADEYGKSITPFIKLLEGHGYTGTTLKLAEHVLTVLYLFLDMHSLGFSYGTMWIWFGEIKETTGHSWRHWRRILRLYEDYVLKGSMCPGKKYTYQPLMYDGLPAWCREAIDGLLEQKKREFREPGTIKSYRCACTRFCRFLVDGGYESFKNLSPEAIKEFACRDRHASFAGRSGCFASVRAFLRYLEEKGHTDNCGLDACLMSGTAPQEKIVDVLTDEQVRRINEYRMGHNGPIELRDAAIVLIGLRMGIRAGDIISLCFQDIDWKKRQISIVMKKTRTQITLPMPVEVGNAIYSYIKSGRPSTCSDYIFVRSNAPYGKLTNKICTNALYRILPERMGVKGGGFHVTRRTFATGLLRNHAGIDDVINALGHNDPTSIMKYLLLDDDRSRKCGLSLADAGIPVEGGLG